MNAATAFQIVIKLAKRAAKELVLEVGALEDVNKAIAIVKEIADNEYRSVEEP